MAMRKWLKTGLLLLLFQLATSHAFAAQYKLISADEYFYVPTTVLQTYGNLRKLKPGEKFQADGVNYYPFEIYLPNELEPANYRLHSNYSKDTDACASCHSIHTAVGSSLLQWYTVYDTCMACHDGTVTTTYNVIEGKIITEHGSAPAFGGAFGTGMSRDRSNHHITGTIKISAAPGGYRRGRKTGLTRRGEKLYQWDAPFTCTSCHSPHGQGGNARVLHPDPNFVQTLNEKRTKLKLTYENGAYVAKNGGERLQMIFGYPYEVRIYKGESRSKVEELTWADYVPDNSKGYTRIFPEPGVLRSGENLYASFVPALKVEMEIENYLTEDELVIHRRGINEFCGACHTDYNTVGEKHPGSDHMVGTYSKAYRHAVGVYYDINKSKPEGIGNGYRRSQWLKLENNKITCLTCHLAHGTNREYWENTIGSCSYIGWVQWGGYGSFVGETIRELSGSSALKRLPNMGVCEACHQMGKANEGYLANSGMEAELLNSPRLPAGIYTSGGGYTTGSLENEECLNCHKSYKFYNQTKHFTVKDMGCEECHGQGGNHLRLPDDSNILKPTADLTIKEQAEQCGACHNEIYSQFVKSEHYQSEVLSCNTCHTSHSTMHLYQLRQEFTQLCGFCHEEAKPFPNHSLRKNQAVFSK